MFKKIMITCDEASTICDKSQYGEASLSDKIKLTLHTILCKICAKYSKQNKIMTTIFRVKSESCKKSTPCLTHTDKEIIKKNLEKVEA